LLSRPEEHDEEVASRQKSGDQLTEITTLPAEKTRKPSVVQSTIFGFFQLELAF
jgi:hypothetical protein